MEKVTKEGLIIRTMPFSQQLKEWCLKHPEFSRALKVNHPERFIHLGAISTSRSPLVPEDEVIGVYALDYKPKTERFKQDFVVNKGGRNQEFILYTRLPGREYSRYVRDINEFFAIYSKDKYYKNAHWIEFKDLPGERLRQRAIEARERARELKAGGIRNLTQGELDDFDSKIPK